MILHSNADRIVYFLLIDPPRTDVPKDGLGIPVLEKKLWNLALMVLMFYVYILYIYYVYTYIVAYICNMDNTHKKKAFSIVIVTYILVIYSFVLLNMLCLPV